MTIPWNYFFLSITLIYVRNSPLTSALFIDCIRKLNSQVPKVQQKIIRAPVTAFVKC